MADTGKLQVKPVSQTVESTWALTFGQENARAVARREHDAKTAAHEAARVKKAEESFQEGRRLEVGGQYAEARRAYKIAVDRNHTQAQVALGHLHSKGLGAPKDEVAALRLYEAAAAKGDPRAMKNVATYYALGKGDVFRDTDKAVHCLRVAAAKDYPRAQSTLALYYESGKYGLQRNDKEALRLYTLAEQQGDPGGQCGLAYFYEMGKGGVKQDLREAIRLYRLAAAQKHEYAKRALRRLGADR